MRVFISEKLGGACFRICLGTTRNHRRSHACRFSFPAGAGVLRFLVIALPFLNDAVAGLSERPGARLCGKIAVFAVLAAFDDLAGTFWEIPQASVPIGAVVLEHGVCGRVITLHRSSNNPPLATMAA